MRQYVDLNSLPKAEKEFYLDDTWCDVCQEADLGIAAPELYIENGQKFVAGRCKVCGEVCISEIIEKQAKD